jgi:hypothetical protein
LALNLSFKKKKKKKKKKYRQQWQGDTAVQRCGQQKRKEEKKTALSLVFRLVTEAIKFVSSSLRGKLAAVATTTVH